MAVPVAAWERVSVPPETEDTVVPDGMSAPVMAWPEATVDGNVPETVAVVEPLVTDTPRISRFGPRFVSAPQSLIRVESVAHQSR